MKLVIIHEAIFLTITVQLFGEIPILAKQSFMQVPNPPGSSDALIRGRD